MASQFSLMSIIKRKRHLMPVYLDEDMVAMDAREIIFPHLLLCAGVVCLMSDDSLIGCHISGSGTEDAVLAEMANQIGASAASLTTMYVVTDMVEHFRHSRLSFTQKAAALGYVGYIRIVNASTIHNGDGVYARLTSVGGGQCQVFVEPDQNARPYAMALRVNYHGTPVVLARNGQVPSAPPFIKTGDRAARPGTAIPPNGFYTARRN